MRALETQLSLRPAFRRDLPALCVIWAELMELHASSDPRFALAPDAVESWRSMAEEILDRQDGFLLVASGAGGPVGFGLGWIARNPPIYTTTEVGFISELAVARAWQRQGIGRMLVSAARQWFKARSINEFQLSTAVWNETAQRFWQAVGGQCLLLRYHFDVDLETHRGSR